MSKSAFEMKHAKSVSVMVLTHPDRPGELAGRIVANWSDNPAGSVCTASVHIWAGPLQSLRGDERAGGGGYCKLSAAVSGAIREGLDHPDEYVPAERREAFRGYERPKFDGAGMSAGREWFKVHGYTLLGVLNADSL